MKGNNLVCEIKLDGKVFKYVFDYYTDSSVGVYREYESVDLKVLDNGKFRNLTDEEDEIFEEYLDMSDDGEGPLWEAINRIIDDYERKRYGEY